MNTPELKLKETPTRPVFSKRKEVDTGESPLRSLEVTNR